MIRIRGFADTTLMVLAAIFAMACLAFAPVQAQAVGFSHIQNAEGVVVASFVTPLPIAPTAAPLLVPIDPSLDPTVPGGTTTADPAGSTASTISTPVYDALTDTYSTVTSTKGSGESDVDFVRRHDALAHVLLLNKKTDAEHAGLDYAKAKHDYDAAHK